MDQYVGAPQRLKDKVAIVTGGGGTNSIGRAICLRYGAEGAKVAVLDVNAAGAARVADEVKAAGGDAIAIPWTSPTWLNARRLPNRWPSRGTGGSISW